MGEHRADVLTPKGVIEFQRSAISSAEIRQREAFYERMVWVVDASGFKLEPAWHWHNKRFLEQKPMPAGMWLTDPASKALNECWHRQREEYATQQQSKSPCFQWLWPRKSWFAANKAIFLDTGDDRLLMIKKIYQGRSTYIACKPITKETFIDRCVVGTETDA